MILISHRGNIKGPNPDTENSPESIDAVLQMGMDCEIDLWVNTKKEIFLGHDAETYQIKNEWLVERKSRLWIHCKNLSALSYFSEKNSEFNFFWHQTDDFTLTSKGYIWTFPRRNLGPRSIAVLPEIWLEIGQFNSLEFVAGICTDYPINVIN